MTNDTSTIYNLQPRNYTYLPDGTENCVGFVAQEVDAIDTNLTTKNIYGQAENIDWISVTTYLVNEIQKQNTTINNLTQTITSLTQRITNLENIQTPSEQPQI